MGMETIFFTAASWVAVIGGWAFYYRSARCEGCKKLHKVTAPCDEPACARVTLNG